MRRTDPTKQDRTCIYRRTLQQLTPFKKGLTTLLISFFFVVVVVVVCLSDILRDTKRDFILIDEKKKKLGPEALTPSPGPELNWDCLPLSFFFFVLLLYLMQCLS